MDQWGDKKMPTINYCPHCAAIYPDDTLTECTNCNTQIAHHNVQVVIVEQDKAESNYRSAIRSMVRALWAGVIDIDQAFDVGETSIRFGLTQAWNAGLQSVGDIPAEQSPQQRIELQQMIANEINLLFPFLLDIEANSKANGGKLGPLFTRSEMWILRATDAENRARASALSDPRLAWRLGITEQHCGSCARLDGKIKKASYWQRLNIRPQSPPNEKLECGGYKCLCFFEPTTEPQSRGPLPSLP